MNNKIILLVGPSGVGKSTTCGLLSSEHSIPTYETDSLIAKKRNIEHISRYKADIGDEPFFEETKLVIEELNPIDSYVIVDVGAGSLDFGVDWYMQYHRICLMNNPENIWHYTGHPDMEDYTTINFNTGRQ